MLKLRGRQGFIPLLRAGAGFTLLEVMVASSLVLLVGMAALSLYITTQKFYNVTMSQLDLQNEANFAMEHIINHVQWGYAASVTGGGIKISVDVDAASPPTIPATTPVTLEYEQDGSTLKYTPDIGSSGTFETILEGVTNLDFSVSEDTETERQTLSISLTVDNGAVRAAERVTLSLSSAVTLRYSASD